MTGTGSGSGSGSGSGCGTGKVTGATKSYINDYWFDPRAQYQGNRTLNSFLSKDCTEWPFVKSLGR
ncbi:hypothetical protein CA13_40740 [Planctomycetes bacterium CA13]|uniref:Uncharacterized protein n=1 Tax=Novipirellula herctigrandis TaxID=2527986 RepID=A0A5C5Z728_9BACT|nr:hypothetical protein CA13_40740 [Planctomycetes bacterium CA13]